MKQKGKESRRLIITESSLWVISVTNHNWNVKYNRFRVQDPIGPRVNEQTSWFFQREAVSGINLIMMPSSKLPNTGLGT